MLVAVLVLLFVGCLLIGTPIAVRIFGRARLADMEKTGSVFSSGRSAMNEVRFDDDELMLNVLRCHLTY